MSQTAWYRSYVNFGQLGLLPVYPGATYQEPQNDVAQPILGNYSPVNVGDGLRSGVLQCQIALRDDASDNVLVASGATAGLMGNFFTRAATCEHDTTDLVNLAVVDCVSRVTIPKAKFNGFSLSASKGSDISLMCQFLCAGVSTVDDNSSSPTSAPAWSTANLLRFNRLTVHTGTAGFTAGSGNIVRPYSVNAAVMLNSSPDMELDGTAHPSDFDAGMLTASLSLVFKAGDAADNLQSPIADGNQVVILITNAAATRVFELRYNYVVNQTPKDRALAPPRLLRKFDYLCLASSGTGFAVSASSSGF